jgi:hypothetical protein
VSVFQISKFKLIMINELINIYIYIYIYINNLLIIELNELEAKIYTDIETNNYFYNILNKDNNNSKNKYTKYLFIYENIIKFIQKTS